MPGAVLALRPWIPAARLQTKAPVFFAFESEATAKLRSLVARNTGDTQIVAGGAETPRRQSQVRVTNLQGWIGGKDEGGEEVPTVAVIAHYDAAAVAPALAVGADSNGSGVIALLQLARAFRKLYAESKTHGGTNLLFVLSAAGRLNFAGTKHWLAHTDPQIVSNIQVALCLDTIGSGDKLFLHTSKPMKDSGVASLFGTMQSAAADAGVPLQLVHKKINISDPDISWEHELFSRKRVLAATLSRRASAEEPRGGLLDRAVDVEALARNTQMLANTLARLVPPPPPLKRFL